MIGHIIRWRFARFCLVGGLSTLTHIIVYIALIELLGTDPVIASVPAFSVAVLVSYTGNYVWTFRSNGVHTSQAPRFVAVATIGLFINVSITYLIVDILNAWYGFALAAVIIIVPVVTYQLNHFWVFKDTTGTRHRTWQQIRDKHDDRHST